MDKKQLKFDFMDGGMVDSGSPVEPSTGNDVPPGSLEKEVADDVPANLSEGEYVLPADVVQFYGLEKIEKLVDKAKESLVEFEAKGRIGGQPSPENDDLPLTDEELLSIFSDEEKPDGEVNMADGGFLPPSTGVQSKVYVGPSGEKRTILFVNGQPIQAIPEGYMPEGQKKEQTKKQQNYDPVKPEGPANEATPEDRKSVSEWGSEDFEGFIGDQKGVSIAEGLLGRLGGPLGSLAKDAVTASNQSRAKEALDEVNSRLSSGSVTPEEKSKLEGYKTGLEGIVGESEQKSGGKGILGGLFDDGIFGKNGLFGQSKNRKAAPSTQRKAAPNATVSTSDNQADKAENSSPSKAGGNEPGPQGQGGFMARGGLVKRRK